MSNTVVDSSIWVDFFNKKSTPVIEHIKSTLINASLKSPFIILPVIMQEVLQGIEENKLYTIVKENLFGFDIVEYENYEAAILAADLYRFLRKRGVTIRKSSDCLIAAICIKYNFNLFHNDNDFTNIAKHTSLKIYKLNT